MLQTTNAQSTCSCEEQVIIYREKLVKDHQHESCLITIVSVSVAIVLQLCMNNGQSIA